tara:strand:- start:878 stop:1222 length:345 start_codon:yes stop_codon:yes gene_type:complete
MTRLEIITSALLTLSVVINIGLFVYARYTILQLLWVSEELGDLQQMINSFRNHLGSVYELEMFYGDESLKALLEHAHSFDEQLDTFQYIYSLTEETEEGDELDDDDKETDPEET